MVHEFGNNIQFYLEENAIKNNSKVLSNCGTKALIVSGKNSIFISGAYDDLVGALNNEGIGFVLFNDVEPNPSLDTVDKARKIGLEEKCDFVIGIGGGSSLDAAKAIALLMTNRDSSIEDLYIKGSMGDNLTKLVLIPTTAGTGSEMTHISVLTNLKTGIKKSMSHSVYADVVYLDYRYLKSASHFVKTCCAFDTISHILEGYISSLKFLIQEGNEQVELSKYGISAGYFATGYNNVIYKNAGDKEDYEKILLCSSYAGSLIDIYGTSLAHGLSYLLTTRFNIPHGKAVQYFLPGLLGIIEEYTNNLNFVDQDTDELRVRRAVFKKFSDFKYELFNNIGVKDIGDFAKKSKLLLGDLDIPVDELDKCIDDSIKILIEDKNKLAAFPFDVDIDLLKNLAKKAKVYRI